MKNRDSYFDNAKFLLILLVVFGHVSRSFIDDNAFMMNVYKFVYTFHMPAFILVSGYFAKGFKKKGYVSKISKKLILPYLIFQGIYSVYYYLVESNSTIVLDPLDPHWSLWFLISLFFWNLLLVPFTKLPTKWALLAAFAVGIAVGYVDFVSNYLSLSRTFVFFPLFLIGFYLDRSHFRALTTVPGRTISISLLLITFLAYFQLDFNYEWLFGSKSFSKLGEVTLLSPFVRMGFYTLTLLTSFSFLALVPNKTYFFTHWGTRTFYVYLLHGFIIQAFRKSEVLEWMKDYQSLTLLIMLSILLTFILSTNIVKTIAQPIIELRATNLKQSYKALVEKSALY
ncbi:acyltransferase family protein [Metabacillus herbersteinensis]|uniref:Acyltransferase family protein n=1 Tax=Metabacillus herbersteinensis TaxID=283816 RepID=A0ABV6GA88_9BACI